MGADPHGLESRFGMLYERGKTTDIHDLRPLAYHADRRIPSSRIGSRPFTVTTIIRCTRSRKKYDSFQTFYVPTAIGSENWQVEAGGRLCQVTRLD